jgi:hypothetical protein
MTVTKAEARRINELCDQFMHDSDVQELIRRGQVLA